MTEFERVSLLEEIFKEVDKIGQNFHTADEHTLNLVKLMIIEKMQEEFLK